MLLEEKTISLCSQPEVCIVAKTAFSWDWGWRIMILYLTDVKTIESDVKTVEMCCFYAYKNSNWKF